MAHMFYNHWGLLGRWGELLGAILRSGNIACSTRFVACRVRLRSIRAQEDPATKFTSSRNSET